MTTEELVFVMGNGLTDTSYWKAVNELWHMNVERAQEVMACVYTQPNAKELAVIVRSKMKVGV